MLSAVVAALILESGTTAADRLTSHRLRRRICSRYVLIFFATSGGTPKPALLAEGVSTALLTTLIGLAIAIPAVSIYNILRNRVQRLVLEVGITSENLMSRFENVGKKT